MRYSFSMNLTAILIFCSLMSPGKCPPTKEKPKHRSMVLCSWRPVQKLGSTSRSRLFINICSPSLSQAKTLPWYRWLLKHLKIWILQPLFRKIAGSLPGLDALSSGKQEDMVDINLRPASGSSASGAAAQLEQKSGGCSCWDFDSFVFREATAVLQHRVKYFQRDYDEECVFAQTSSSDILTSIARSQFLCTDLFSKLSYTRI